MLSCPKCGSSYTREVERCGLDGERLVPTDRDPLLGRTVDRYRVDELLGDGGMARVYRATHVYLGQECAIKVLLGEVASDRSLARRFQREAQASSRIQHPNVVHILDFGQTKEGLIFMAMELLRGRTLSDLLRAEGPLDPARAAYFARQIAEGLAAAHALGFVHRDLKPKNVMLTGATGHELAKILDFGLVLFTGAASLDATSLTEKGQVFGTPGYMAPEQVSGTEVTPRADLYALGVILFQMLSGSVPFGGTPAQVALHHVSTPPASLPYHDGLGPIAMRCLAKSPDERCQTAGEVVRLIDALALTSLRPPAEVPRPELSSRTIELSAPLDEPALGDAKVQPAEHSGARKARAQGPSGESDVGAVRLDAPIAIDDSHPSLPRLAVVIDERPPLGRERRTSSVEPELDRALSDAGLRGRSRRRLAAVAAALSTLAAAGWLLSQGTFGADDGAEPAPDAVTAAEIVPDAALVHRTASESARTSGGRAADDAGAEGPDATPDASSGPTVGAQEHTDASLEAGPADAAVAVRPAAVDAGRRAARRPRGASDGPPVDEDTFARRDRALVAALERRGLGWSDVSAAAPDSAREWAVWRIGADRPTADQLADVASELEAAIAHVRVDGRLLEVKLDRALAALRSVPAARQGSAYQALLSRYSELAHALPHAKTSELVGLAGRLTALEKDADSFASP